MEFKKDDKVIIIDTNNIWQNKLGIVVDSFENETTDEIETYLVKVSFDDGKTVIQTFDAENLKLADMTETLNENKKNNEKDFIYDYVTLEDIDDNVVPSWMFVDKLAAAENISAEKVIENAKKLGYNLFMISQNQFKKIIVAAPKCKVETIKEEYVDYLLGSATITKFDNKGE